MVIKLKFIKYFPLKNNLNYKILFFSPEHCNGSPHKIPCDLRVLSSIYDLNKIIKNII